MFKGKNVLVTGGAGFVGTNLIMRLLREGARVRATLHRKDAHLGGEGIEFLRCDLRNPEDCRKATEGMDYVFLCAANTSGAAVMEKTPLVHLTPNIVMNVQMMEAAYEAGVKKLLFISSNTVYPVTDFPVKESDVNYEFFEKYYIVGWMKYFSELVCGMYSTKIQTPLETVVVRPANIYGPYDDFEWETSHVLPALMRRVIERHQPLEVWGDGKDVKDFIYIDDFVDGMMLAMERLEGFQPINIASGQPISIREALKIIMQVEGYTNADVRFDASKPTMIPLRLIDPSLAEQKLGFKARTPFPEGIRKTLEWYRNRNG